MWTHSVLSQTKNFGGRNLCCGQGLGGIREYDFGLINDAQRNIVQVQQFYWLNV